jgi:hypothetical protein
MFYRVDFSKVIIIFTLFFFLLANNRQELFGEDNQSFEWYLFGFPYTIEDTCHSFLDYLFTVGGVRTGIKFAQTELKQKNGKKITTRKNDPKINNDTTSTNKANKILSVRESERGDKFYIYIQVENPEHDIKIVVYNLLGKKVLDVYEGKPKDQSQPYELSVSELPKGIFLLVVIGENFRLREKIVITR